MSTSASILRGTFSRLVADASHGDDPAFREIAATQHVLPLYADIGGVIVLDERGVLLSKRWDDADFSVEGNASFRLAALVEGARKYPELRFMLPDRPADAVVCPDCGGMGIFTKAPALGLTCGRCCGLGWLKADRQIPRV